MLRGRISGTKLRDKRDKEELTFTYYTFDGKPTTKNSKYLHMTCGLVFVCLLRCLFVCLNTSFVRYTLGS